MSVTTDNYFILQSNNGTNRVSFIDNSTHSVHSTFIDNCIILVQNGHNAMHKAAEGGSLDVIKYLLPMFGARVHEKDMFSYTMLHWAAQKGHCQVARYLITELKLDPQDRDKVCEVPGHAGFKGLCVCMV